MKKKTLWILIICFLLIVGYMFIVSLSDKKIPKEIRIDLKCDALTAQEVCPEGYDCINFERIGFPVCAKAENPCSYYKCSGPFNDCVIMESYPLQVACR